MSFSRVLKISEFCKTGSGGTPSRGNADFYINGTIPWVKSGELRENIILDTSEKITEEAIQKSSAKIVPKGSLLLAMYGATVGRLAFLGIDAATNQAICNIQPDENVAFPKYLYYVLSNKVPEFLNMAAGGAQPNISQTLIKDTKIPLPPLKEQKRIAAILDKADAIRCKRQQAIDLTDQFLRSVFLDMFGDPVTNLKGWDVNKWKDVLNIINGKNQKKVEIEDGEYPIYGSGGEMARARDYLCDENTVIIGRKGNINKPILVKEKFWNVDTAFGLASNPDLLNYNYLYWFCKFFNFERLNKTVTIPSLTKGDLLEIEMPVPPIDLQNKFGGICKKIIGGLSRYENHKKISEDLFSSLTQQAFNGELSKQSKAA